MPKAFISYYHKDDSKRKILEELLKDNGILPLVVSERTSPSTLLSDKVVNDIEKADFLVPVLTRSSINTQWINQEIGYASKLAREEEIKIFPLVEDNIISELRGFIHKQMDLPFKFKGGSDLANENYYFKKACKELVVYLKTLPDDKDGSPKMFFLPSR